jgi:photosynthetic reaction center cytochrome c subunit
MTSTTRLALAIVIALTVLPATPGAQTPAPEQGRTGSPAAEKTAEQEFKNIQAFKGLPASQLLPTMRFIAGALGVDCEYCHVQIPGEPRAMERDDKETKLTARTMIAMMRAINGGHFNGQLRVNCATCHHGSPRPSTVPPVLQPGALPAGEDKAEDSAPAAEVLAAYIEALGGRTAIEKVTSRVSTGTTVNAMGQKTTFEIVQARPDRLRITMTSAGGGIAQGVDGNDVWSRGRNGTVVPVTGPDNDRLRRMANLSVDLMLLALDPKLTAAPVETIGGHKMQVLRGTLTNGQAEHLYFDAQTHLLARRVILTPTPLGPMPDQTDYEDYRPVDGVRVPFLLRRAGPTSSTTFQCDRVRQNVPAGDLGKN